MKPASAVLRQQMADLELQLAAQSQALDAARSAVEATEARMRILQSELDSVTFAVETLPPELISLIFRFVRYNDGNRLVSPQPLLGVCSVWRQVALGSSALWTHIAVNIGKLPLPVDFPAAMLEWLARAGNLPLFLTIHGPSHYRFDINRLEPVFRRHSSQMKELVLQDMSEKDIVAVDGWRQLSFPILEDTVITVPQRDVYDVLDINFLLKDAPRLRNCKLVNIELTETLPWTHLTRFTVTPLITVSECVQAIRQLAELEYLDVELFCAGSTSETPLVHTTLRELHLEIVDEMEEFFSAFTFPALEILDMGQTTDLESFDASIIAFLDRSQPPLRELVLCAQSLDLLQHFTSKFALKVLTLDMPSRAIVDGFFGAYERDAEFCATLETLRFTIRATDRYLRRHDTSISALILPIAGRSIKQRRDALGASFALTSFRVTRIQPPGSSSTIFLKPEKLDDLRNLKAGGMEILLDVDEDGRGSLV
ncbi:F-box domain-containing protein [Mycena kentingensis (nom. inval.)]|nr:F-box domain-containing protein [Mycena kentingensis (nom. inval.)]